MISVLFLAIISCLIQASKSANAPMLLEYRQNSRLNNSFNNFSIIAENNAFSKEWDYIEVIVNQSKFCHEQLSENKQTMLDSAKEPIPKKTSTQTRYLSSAEYNKIVQSQKLEKKEFVLFSLTKAECDHDISIQFSLISENPLKSRVDLQIYEVQLRKGGIYRHNVTAKGTHNTKLDVQNSFFMQKKTSYLIGKRKSLSRRNSVLIRLQPIHPKIGVALSQKETMQRATKIPHLHTKAKKPKFKYGGCFWIVFLKSLNVSSSIPLSRQL